MSAEQLSPGWRRVKFGDVVRQVKDKVDPETAGIERYVAGEHMDTDDLRIRRWGEVGDGYLGPAFTTRFKPGQVLYGSRRTYLRKVALADFEGICANTTFVVESATDDLLPEFLPYVMTAEAFHEHSIKQSKGSVNPYINFSDLKWYEFAVPPLDEQKRIADLISQLDESRDRYAIASQSAVRVANAAMEAFFARQSESETLPLSDCCSSPISYGIVQPGPIVADGVPFVNVEDMTSGRLDPAALPRTSLEISQRHSRTLLKQGDVIVALRGPIGLASVVGQELSGSNLSRGVARLALRPELEASFVRACFKTSVVQRQILRMQTGSTFSELKIGALRQIRIPVPSGPVQRRLVEQVEAALGVSTRCEDSASATGPLRAALLASSLEEALA